MESFLTPDILVTFITLTALEIVLGIDNLIFIALVVSKLPAEYSRTARFIGLGLALIIRVLMLMGVKWIMSLTEPLFTFIIAISFKDLLLLSGGLFLLIKGGMEIHSDLTGEKNMKTVKSAKNFPSAIMQIVFIDFVFSFDSIITAIGMTTNIPNNIPIIVVAVVISMIVMLVASGGLAKFLDTYPGFKMLGIMFIMLIGVVLVSAGIHHEINKNYIYAALVFSTLVEIVNTLHRRKYRISDK